MGVDELDTTSPDVSPETLDAGAASPEVVTEAESSPAPQAKDEKSVLSIVRDAVGKDETPESSAGKERDPQAAQSAKEPDDEDFSDAPFHKHPRFRALVEQRNALRPAAESYRKIEAFCTENAIESSEAAQALNWLAQMKRDPAAAWEEIKPTINALLVTIGEIIPPDLRAEINAGRMTQEHAKQLSKERAKATIANGAMSFRDQQETARQRAAAAQAQAEKIGSIKSAAREWEATARSGDADFAKKAEALEKEVLYLQRKDGVPDSADGVKAQLTKAMKAVNANLAALRPRRPGIQPVIGGSTSGTPRSKPKSVLEIIQSNG